MQKKLVLLLVFLMITLIGCSIAPFNTEADLSYDNTQIKNEVAENGSFEIAITNDNDIEAEIVSITYKIDSGIENVLEGSKLLTKDIDASQTTVFQISTELFGASINNVIEITNIKIEDENDNDIELGALSLKLSVLSEGSDGTSTTKKAVEGLTVQIVSNTEVQISWTESDYATKGYKIYKYENKEGVYSDEEEVIATVGSEITTSLIKYNDENVKYGYTYFYRVTAVNLAGEETPKQTKYISIVLETEEPIAPVVEIPAPSNVVGESKVNSIKISWDKVEVSNVDIIGYNIYVVEKVGANSEAVYRLNEFPDRDDLTDEEKAQSPNVVNVNSIIIQNGYKYGDVGVINSGEKYYFKVAAVRGDTKQVGNKSFSSSAYMYNDKVPVLTSNDIEITVGSYVLYEKDQTVTGAKIRWNDKTDDIDGFIIYRSKTINGDYEQLSILNNEEQVGNFDTIGISNWYVDSSILEFPNSEVFYKIRCKTASGGLGVMSGAVKAKDQENGEPPVINTLSSFLWISRVGDLLEAEFVSVTIADDGTITKKSIEDTVPLDFAGYKVYVSTVFDGEYRLVYKTYDLNFSFDPRVIDLEPENKENPITKCKENNAGEINLSYLNSLPSSYNVSAYLTNFYEANNGVGDSTDTDADYFIRISKYDNYGNETLQSLPTSFSE